MLTVMLCLVAAALPEGSAPEPVDFPHFPDRLYGFVWRNWPLVEASRMAEVVGAETAAIEAIGVSMGLPPQRDDVAEVGERAYITVIRRNWHLLPYDQLLTLLGWTEDELAYTLREDDFLFVKLGRLKPECAPLRYEPPSAAAKKRAAEIKAVVGEHFPNLAEPAEPLFAFVDALSAPLDEAAAPPESQFDPRFCYSYFAPYGDALLDPTLAPYPDGLLQRLAASGANGVWLHTVLYKLAPFPWKPEISEGWEARLDGLKNLVDRAAKYGMGIYLYLNEPRAMPASFFEAHPGLRGVQEDDHYALCTSVPEVREYLREAVAMVCREVPDIAAFFTITASENLTNCWSHHHGENCPRCKDRDPGTVIAEVNDTVQEGIEQSGADVALIAWDWGWRDDWAPRAIAGLPEEAALMSVSEWSIPIERGGVHNAIGEYSLSTIGPGPRATKHWTLAGERGLDTVAKIQAGNTWEIAAVPYNPVVANVAQHAANLREAGVDGLMLGWTLGGYPSPNLAVVAEIGRDAEVTVEDALSRVAERRYGKAHRSAIVAAWEACSTAFRKFPFHGGVVYRAPLQMGPANLLWREPTGYRSTMVGIPYDDLDGWRANYPADVFMGQFEKMADGYEQAAAELRETVGEEAGAIEKEIGLMETVAIHFRSIANQVRFILRRESGQPDLLRAVVKDERELAVRQWRLQRADTRIGFEATNHYFYIPHDLVEKVVNCDWLLNQL